MYELNVGVSNFVKQTTRHKRRNWSRYTSTPLSPTDRSYRQTNQQRNFSIKLGVVSVKPGA
jgi:hypothetical protein